ncbi:hypothetical protein H4R34_000490 [Dimargaris verticillata]|uniref:Centromere protein X n=1 Tax=Dimargaris verticillata TaxID=2761393 RepID=A0A9W8BBS6_9FUNG|nr:hypothetical protein H4R34_000490 [Dimargaris verticillata]
MEPRSAFKPETILAILREHWHENEKIKPEAVQLAAELVRLLTIEAIHRAAEEARSRGSLSGRALDLEHLEKILPQLLLDF